MRTRASLIGLGLALMAMSAAAQSGTVPLFSGSTYSAPSNITELNGNVGIGTTSPTAPLHVVGPNLGSVLGTTSNLFTLQNGNGNTSFLSFYQLRSSNGNDWQTTTTRIQQVIDTTGMGYMDFNPPNGNFAIAFGSGTCCNSTTVANEYMRIANGGNVGIGTTAPGYKLDVAGVVNAQSGVRFPDGNTQMYAFNPANCGADYAESVDVSGDRTKYEAGDVLVIDPDAPGKFLKSNQAYSTLVAGIYSTKPGFVGRLEPATAETKATEVPMAMVGRVPTKVTAENGPIKVGDLLVSSSTVGYAMKGTDRSLFTGAVIGKALGSLDSGTGTILVLVTLQ